MLLAALLAMFGRQGLAMGQFGEFEEGAMGAVPQAVQVELLADTARVEPGQTFRLGVLYTIIPHWHIYWRNPGDTGMPTSLDFELPQGFTVSELNWPAPGRFVAPGDLVSFGYEKQVLLWANVTAPDDLDTTQPLTLKARTDWLACRTQCVIGGADLALTLPSEAPDQVADDKALFDTWQAGLPIAVDAPASPATASVVVQRQGAAIHAAIALHWREEPANIELFPGGDATLMVMHAKQTYGNMHSQIKRRLAADKRPRGKERGGGGDCAGGVDLHGCRQRAAGGASARVLEPGPVNRAWVNQQIFS
jgi:DsbC/DsbD-like thiol-disulfide interchange protein